MSKQEVVDKLKNFLSAYTKTIAPTFEIKNSEDNYNYILDKIRNLARDAKLYNMRFNNIGKKLKLDDSVDEDTMNQWGVLSETYTELEGYIKEMPEAYNFEDFLDMYANAVDVYVTFDNELEAFINLPYFDDTDL